MNFKELRGLVATRLTSLSKPVQVLPIAAVCLITGIALFWLLNQTFYYFLAKSYVDDIADAYSLNRGYTAALIWMSFAALVALFGLVFSFSKRKRAVGYVGLLGLIVGHSVAIGLADRNFKNNGQAEKCFVMARDDFKILNRVGIDPETGRECRPLTPVMAEKIEEYRKGKRPTRLTAGTPAFFSSISGEPVVWYAKTSDGGIELFDLMGYHPQTGEELTPVNREIVDLWKKQNEKVAKRAPVRIDPNTYGFFDPIKGTAKVWFWKDASANYEFYDGPGFQPRTGDPLQIVTRESIAEWKQSLEDALATKKAAQEQREREAREKAEREERERQERADAERREAEAKQAVEQERLQSANECDQLAANPTDERRKADGVPFDLLKARYEQAIDACTRAQQAFPTDLRFQYQLGRALQFKDRKRAFEIMKGLTEARYPAAFDNLGGMYMYDRKDIPKAIQYFKIGASLNDADSMVSLADLVDKGMFGQENTYQIKWSLLSKAAQLNHGGAQRAVAQEKARIEQSQIDQENSRRAMEAFGRIVGGFVR